MLKFFRIYNKYILAIGAAVLMIAFLIQPVMSMFAPSQDSMIIGELNGESIRHRDRANAHAEMNVLLQLPLISLTMDDNAERWMLVIRETQRLGLSASPREVDELLEAIGVDDATQNRIASRYGMTSAFVKQAVRHWIMAETYRQLVLGETRTPPLGLLSQLGQYAQYYGPGFAAQSINQTGRLRLSKPVLRRFIVDQKAMLDGKLVMIDPLAALPDTPQPSEAELNDLFNEYADQFAGQSEPYGFGYRIPARVKIETLTIPYDPIADDITVDEVDALAHYDSNKTDYTDDEGKQQDYTAARSLIIERLRDRAAQAKLEEMVRRARAVLLEAPAFRALTEKDGYKVLPEDYTPLSLRVVADTIEQEYGVKPVVRYAQDWVAVNDLIEMSGIGNSSLSQRGSVYFDDYVRSLRELESDDNPLTSFHLQVGVVSQPMRSRPGDRHLFRILEAEPDHAPASLDLVRENVTKDARVLTAYNTLVAQLETWNQKAANEGLEAIAKSLETSVLNLDAVSRGRGLANPEESTPMLPGVGRNAEFVAHIFELAQNAWAADAPIADQPVADRILTMPIEDRMKVAVFRLEDYKPMTETQFTEDIRSPQWQGMASIALHAADPGNPLSYEAMAKRVGYVSDQDSRLQEADEELAETQAE